MMEQLEPLSPWQKQPAWWVCAECAAPATGWYQQTGILVFHCPEHEGASADALELLGYPGSYGYDKIRQSWGYWLAGFYWRARAMTPARRRRRREVDPIMMRDFNFLFDPEPRRGLVQRIQEVRGSTDRSGNR